MLPWTQRPLEPDLFNRAYCAVLLRQAVEGHQKTARRGLDYAAAFMVLPVVLHPATRNLLPGTLATKLHFWAQRHHEVRIGFAARMQELVPITKEALLHSIVLYNFAGDTRLLPFKLGQVNIITGESETGKSSLINILDYCTGRSKFTMFEAEGVDMGVVAWYAVVLQIGWTQVFIAKPPPRPGGDSQSRAHFQKGTFTVLPALAELQAVTSDDGIDAELSNLLGIAPNKALSPTSAGKDPGQATVQHTKYFLFQHQNLVSSPKHLFWRQDDPTIVRHLRDALFYFLGADQDDRWEKEKTLDRYRKELQKLENRHRFLELRQGEQNQGLRTLLLQAQQAGLVASDVPDAELLATLRAPAPLPSTTARWSRSGYKSRSWAGTSAPSWTK